MQRLFNDQWTFAKLNAGSSYIDACAASFDPVDLPHDFLIGNTDDLYETCDGWYRRTLTVSAEQLAKVWQLVFDGVYMDCDVLVNGAVVCTHHYGYTAFTADLTNALLQGENEVMVHIRHRSPNSRWYSGAGIFRDVTLRVLDPIHLDEDSLRIESEYFKDEKLWQVYVSVSIHAPAKQPVTLRILNSEGKPVHLQTEHAQRQDAFTFFFDCSSICAHPWSPASPYLYTAELTYGSQVIRRRFGLRTVEADPERGFLLNGEVIKLHGVCLHHDLGALGSAFHEKAARRQLRIMQDMGVNALRTSHNPPASKLLDLCDEMGVLVIDEFTDMWEMPKTPYDYARFFDDDVYDDVRSWVCRDRTHPSVVMWSIGNEILDTHASVRGAEITQLLKNLVLQHDDRHALITIGSNYMPWDGAQQCADILKIAGYNYGEKYYEQHHAAHPDWTIYGSETASSLSSRGVYHFPIESNILSDEDLQCSALGNSTSSWGCRDLRKMIVDDMNCPYSMGQFIWSGIDYIGEPTPYHTRSCYFGHVDTAGFPKDGFYQFRSIWRDEPMAHIGVTWCWNEGQLIDVPVMTTGASCELLLNGRSLGVKQVNRRVWQESLPTWKVPYEPGVLVARAYDTDGHIIAEDVRRTYGDSAALALEAEDAELLGDGHDMTFVTVTALDAEGNPVENACDRIHVSVTGAARLLGVDNGDSTDLDGYRTTNRHLFSGKLLIMVGALDHPGTAHISVTAPGLQNASIELPVRQAEAVPGSSCLQRIEEAPMPTDMPVRRIDLKPLGSVHLDAEHPSVTFSVTTQPAFADQQSITYRIVTDVGIASPCAALTQNDDGTVTVTARGDGMVYLRAVCSNGYPHTRIISQQEIFITGMGKPYLDPYDFITGGLYDISDGDISSGNEKGVSFARESYSMVGFSNIDFGPVGSDEITLPIFALSGDLYQITLYRGDPRCGGEKICTLDYQKPSIWNTYQPQTYRLPIRLTGVQTLCFSMELKVHLKGFSFTRQNRAWLPLRALDADHLYGDSFTRTDNAVSQIGNNVSLVYEGMDFEGNERVVLTLDAFTPLDENPVNVVMVNADGQERRELCSFTHTPERSSQHFELPVLPGLCTVSFVFLPGSQFDFYGFQFAKPE